MTPTIIVPDTALLIDVAQQAHAQHLHLITDGTRVVLSPQILPGWHRMAVKVKGAPLNPLETPLCAAA